MRLRLRCERREMSNEKVVSLAGRSHDDQEYEKSQFWKWAVPLNHNPFQEQWLMGRSNCSKAMDMI
jgi:hypothetical protein